LLVDLAFKAFWSLKFWVDYFKPGLFFDNKWKRPFFFLLGWC